MKAILLPIKPKYVAKILNGDKTIEVRKSKPNVDLPIDVYIYCTKDNKQRLYPVALLDKSNQVFKRAYREDKIDNRANYLNGKVVAKFTLKEIRLAKYQPYVDEASKMVNELTCLTDEELDKYLNKKNGYGWVIDDLVIFDEPKELSEFKVNKKYWCNKCPYQYGICLPKCEELKPLTKAPQSYQFIESEK